MTELLHSLGDVPHKVHKYHPTYSVFMNSSSAAFSSGVSVVP